MGKFKSDIYTGDCVEVLKSLPEKSVHCVVTSPPYWGLRKYGGDPGMIGMEPIFEEHLDNLLRVFKEVKRVLRDDGTFWLNYGDAYSGGGRSQGSDLEGTKQSTNRGSKESVPVGFAATGLSPKNLIMMPARIAMALQEDGWILRSEIIWAKNNPMPEPVTDRPTSMHEKIYLFSKSKKYFYDITATRVPHKPISLKRIEYGIKHNHTKDVGMKVPPLDTDRIGERFAPEGGRNLRNVWNISTYSYKGAHFATFPPKLVEPCIKAGTSEMGCCVDCGTPWVREIKKGRITSTGGSENESAKKNKSFKDRQDSGTKLYAHEIITTGWKPSCDCEAETKPCVVMDPFGGSGTVGEVAAKHGRNSIIIEINDGYTDLAYKRIRKSKGVMLLDVNRKAAGDYSTPD